MISLSIRKELESLPTLLKKLEPKDRIDVMIKLIAYIAPKANSENDDPLVAKQDKNNFFSKSNSPKNLLFEACNCNPYLKHSLKPSL